MDESARMGAHKRRLPGGWLSAVAIALFLGGGAWVSVHAGQPADSKVPEARAAVAAPVLSSDRSQERHAAAQAIVRALAPPASRRLPGLTAEERELQQLATNLGAPGAHIENPCVEWSGPFCIRTVLEPLFTRLDELRAGTASSRVTVSAFGNSLIAADRIVDIVRERLVHQFGDGGRGLLLVDRLADYGPRSRTSHSANGWLVHTVGDIKKSPWPLGLTGVVHVSSTPKARSRFELAGETQGALFWVDKSAGPIELRVNGQMLVTTSPGNTGKQQRTDFTLPTDAKTLELIAHKRGTAIHGLALDRPTPGLVLDTLGVPAADASLFLEAQEEMVTEQLRSRAPALVMMMLGGNEVKRLQWGRSTIDKVERDLRRFIHRVRQAAPGSACLVVGPLDAVLGPDSSRPFQQRSELREVIELERRIAQEEGCAFFDMFAAMGGTGSLQRFHARGLVHDDLVHPRGRGLDVLGAMLSDALLRAWSDTPRIEQPYALEEAWATLVGGDLLPHEAPPWRQTPSVALMLPRNTKDPVVSGMLRVLAASRAGSPRAEEARWLVLEPGATQQLPRAFAKEGPVALRCAALVSPGGELPSGEPCLTVALPPLPPDLQDPRMRGVAAGAWLLAEIARHDLLWAARSQR
jgi:lysophospholipase L1-like esterase